MFEVHPIPPRGSITLLSQMLADVDELVFEGLRSRLPYLAGLHRRSDAMMAVYPVRVCVVLVMVVGEYDF